MVKIDSSVRCVGIGILLIFVIQALISGPLRESFGWCDKSWCSPYRTAMDRCFNKRSGPIYDDRLTDLCEKQIERFGNQHGDLPGVATPHLPYGGMNKSILRLLNQGNMNIAEGFNSSNYAFVPRDMSGEQKGPPKPSDTEHVSSMGQHLKLQMIEHLTEKVPGQTFSFNWGSKEPHVVEEDDDGYQTA